MKQSFLLLLLISLCSGCSDNSGKTVTQRSFPSNPNIILIVGDDVGYEILTCNGGQSYSTPHLDSIAANGLRFTQCFASPLCSPSRVMLLTGKYNFRNYYEWGILNTNQLTIGNLLKDNGYKTYYSGKWQLDGGDASIRKFGFDNYTVWLPFATGNDDNESKSSRYKSPVLYSHNNYISAAKLKDKYGDDVFTDSIESFITKNAQNKFFVYYAMALTHKPFCPTPDNPDFAGWKGSHTKHSDSKYFPDMVAYMDKKIGELISFLQKNNLDKNTVVIYTGDNGTPNEITSLFNGQQVPGGKFFTTTYGTHVPLIIYWPGKIAPGIDDNLVSFPDILPTIAKLTNSPVPGAFNPIDGVSFYNQLSGDNSQARKYIYNYYHYDTAAVPVQWAQNKQFKLYDSTPNTYHAPGFYDMQNDIMETNPLPYSGLSAPEITTEQNLQHVLDSLK